MQSLGLDKEKYITIAVDGLDGSGKGACVDEMAGIISSKGCPVIISDYPNYKYPWGSFLDHLLHESDEDLNVDDRLLVYALNRLETVPIVQKKVKSYLEVYDRVCVLFDRYPTSAMLTLSFYKLFKELPHSSGELLAEFLPKMWKVDRYFVEYFDLEDTKIVVPVLDAEETMKRINQDTQRDGLDAYEKTDIQDLARELYIKASHLDKRIITFSQYKGKPHQYMTIEENAQKSLSLTWPSILEEDDTKKRAPIDEIEYDPTLVDEEIVGKLLEEQGSIDLKRFDPYK